MATPTSRYPAAEGSSGVVTTWLPLTTVYPIVPRCKNEFYSPNNMTQIFAYDPNQNALTFSTKCWPSEARSWWNQETDATAITSLGPFVCPEAYTAVVTEVVNPGSTLTGCCPSGYDLSSLMSQPYAGECTSSFTSGATITYVSSWTPGADGYTTITTVLETAHAIQAVQINGYNFDGNSAESTVTAFSSRTSSSTSSGSASGFNTALATSGSTLSASEAAATSAISIPPASNNSGLSTGAKIGLAVGISVGVIVIAALISIIYFMRRKGYGTAPQQDTPYSSSEVKMGQITSLPSSLGSEVPHELHSMPVHEINGSTSAELDGNHGY
ncbi:e9ba2647-3038-4010-ba97-f684bac53c83 [Sclerotinia trifoliorum]|uniref:E9ba2647-3038-4010-ba97-f684bac53c83 n=1 Tax=Sclerotinia trifoliorum TaxID=28548 RepID=A0A8H2W291_9HELO|nr:e9ba2647-3038-4010-ba97-f684bac53c83 [Sclerotinia trifoliorum]